MRTEDSGNTKQPTRSEQPRKRPTYKIVSWRKEDREEWERLDNDRITAMEDGNFDLAGDNIEKMIRHQNPCDYSRVQETYLKHAKKMVEEMRDPLHNDEDFKKLIGTDRILHPSYEKAGKLAELWRLQIYLLNRLRVSKLDSIDEDRRVAHYCRTDVLPSILKDGMKLFSLSATNDPTEGKRFARFIGHAIDSRCDKKKNRGKEFTEYAENHPENMLALQCSFSSRVNDLNQFRLYGRDSVDGGEGTGLCLVFKMNYFDNMCAPAIPTKESVDRNEMEKAEENEYSLYEGDDVPYLPAYWVLYYDTQRDMFYYTPCQRERPFCTDGGRSDRDAMSIFRKARHNQEAIQKLLNKIKDVFADLVSLTAEKEGWNLCVYLRHLIKDAAFRDEQEMRVLKLCSFGDAAVESLNGNGLLSLPYHRIFVHDCDCPLVEIIAGPKVKGFMVFRDRIRHILAAHDALKDVNVVQSDVPLA